MQENNSVHSRKTKQVKEGKEKTSELFSKF